MCALDVRVCVFAPNVLYGPVEAQNDTISKGLNRAYLLGVIKISDISVHFTPKLHRVEGCVRFLLKYKAEAPARGLRGTISVDVDKEGWDGCNSYI